MVGLAPVATRPADTTTNKKMASYSTIPAAEEPLVAKPQGKSLKALVAGAAVASFALDGGRRVCACLLLRGRENCRERRGCWRLRARRGPTSGARADVAFAFGKAIDRFCDAYCRGFRAVFALQRPFCDLWNR